MRPKIQLVILLMIWQLIGTAFLTNPDPAHDVVEQINGFRRFTSICQK